MPEATIAGVDGGASKTRAAVLSAGGKVLATSTVRSASAYHREAEEAAGIVVASVREAMAAAGIGGPLEALGAGLAGADDPAIRARLERTLAGAGLAASVLVDHDAAAALAGGTALEPGIVVIAGTGSIAFGVDAQGRRARAGGWGPLLDDEGSGYAIGRAVLRAAMRAFDGRGETTALAESVRQHFGLGSLAGLKMAVRGIGIDEVAAIAPLAVDAARGGDAVATRILQRAGRHLAAMVAAVAAHLGWREVPFPLVAVGGAFEAGALILHPLAQALEAAGYQAGLQPARFPPEVGAALLAARAARLDAAGMIRALTREGVGRDP
ncbi:MAG: BadF/BadG/BcrA/BcrD ATPase family protein [Armatimonadota bacterium]|nr:BadF/BadG/BcrA/BcrD ATPase family protein [Armatimonadota bacterium]MDR7519676.1 BadF/BadG/BcrA/BcrD ATPase family protein [Armatimonadota bacterium]MDR7550762.1 BadF/BadG/BcrA/BcrD ATPase family protein [Armatimonadota bacterium]